MEKFFILIGLHFLADFSLQNDFQAKLKGSNKYIMLSHCVVWTFCIMAGLKYLGIYSYWKLLFLYFGHFYIDAWKCKRTDKSKALTTDLYIDQFLHFIQLIIVYLF